MQIKDYLVGLESIIHVHVEILKMEIDFKYQIKNNFNLVFFIYILNIVQFLG